MVQLTPSEAGAKLVARHDDGLDLRLAKARLVMIGLEERARATARHLSSCEIESARCGLRPSVNRPGGGGLCRFLRFRNRSFAFTSFWPSSSPVQRCRRRLTKQRAVGNRKATKFPEPVIRGDLADSRPFHVGIPQCAACQMHSPEPEIPLWAHAQILQATVTQFPIGRADLRGEFRHV